MLATDQEWIDISERPGSAPGTAPRLGSQAPALAALLVLVVAGRLACFEREPVVFDELSTAEMAALPARVIVAQFHLEGREFGQMPLAFLLARAGVTTFGPTLAGMRTPFFLCGVLGIAVVLGLAWRWDGPSTGLLAALLTAASPAHVSQSHIARFYALVFLAAAASLPLLVELARRPSVRVALAWSVVTLIGLYTHHSHAIFTASSVVVTLAVAGVPSWAGVPAAGRRRYRRALARALAAMLVAVAVGYAPWYSRAMQLATHGVARMSAHAKAPRADGTRPGGGRVSMRVEMPPGEYHLQDLRNPLVVGFTTLTYLNGGTWQALILMPIFLAGVIRPPRRWRIVSLVQVVVWSATLAIVALAIGRTRALFHPRYLFFLLPLYLVGLAWGIQAVGRGMARLLTRASPAGRQAMLPAAFASATAAVLVTAVLLVEGTSVAGSLSRPGNEAFVARIERRLAAATPSSVSPPVRDGR